MQKEKKSSSIRLLLQWAGKEKYWMYLAVILSFFSGICTMIPYYGIYSLMSAVYTGTCTTEFVIRDAGIIAGGIVIRVFIVWCIWCGISQRGLSCIAEGALYGDRPHGKSTSWCAE